MHAGAATFTDMLTIIITSPRLLVACSYESFIPQHAPPNSVKMILGNKSDLTEYRAVTTERGKEVGGGYSV